MYRAPLILHLVYIQLLPQVGHGPLQATAPIPLDLQLLGYVDPLLGHLALHLGFLQLSLLQLSFQQSDLQRVLGLKPTELLLSLLSLRDQLVHLLRHLGVVGQELGVLSRLGLQEAGQLVHGGRVVAHVVLSLGLFLLHTEIKSLLRALKTNLPLTVIRILL